MATYLNFHHLEQSPFEGAGSERLVLATEALRRAFAEIKSGLDEDSPRICLSGGPGIGKSSLARALPKLLGKEARCALVRDPSRDWLRIKASLAKQLTLEGGQLSRASLLAARPRGKRLVLVVDQAEHLPAESLEQLDALLGYQDDQGGQLLQCVLLANLEDAPRGQDVPILWWLDQLTTRQLMMAPIPENGLRSYVDKHLKKAGANDTSIFEDDALLAIHRYTGGVPGAVSALCEQLLDKAASKGSRIVTASLVASVFGDPPPPRRAAPAREAPRAAAPVSSPEPTSGEEEDPSSLFDHSNTPPPIESEPAPSASPLPDMPLPQFGDRRTGKSRRAVTADAFSPPEPEPELQVQPGILPLDKGSNHADDSDFFAPLPARPEPGKQTHASMPLAHVSPGSGRGARAVRNLIAVAVLAVAAAAVHAWWKDRSTHADPTPAARHAAAAAKPAKSDPEAAIHPLVPPDQRELARRSLALEDTQGREDDPAPVGLTSDLKLDPSDLVPNAGAPAAERDRSQVAAEARAGSGSEGETGPDEFSPWTQQGPGGSPAAPAPGR